MLFVKTCFIAVLVVGACFGFTAVPRDASTGRPLHWWQMLDKYQSIGILPGIEYSPSSAKACLVWDENINDGPENDLWYFREDFLVNAQHLFWHVTNPNGFADPDTPLPQNRRGELFYYFHRNMLARYDAERLSVGFDRVKALVFEEGALLEMGYDPHFHENKTSFYYPPRLDNLRFENITYNTDMLRIIEADISNQTIFAINGSLISLNNGQGIDLLADLIEASTSNVNEYRYSYFGVHNDGHSDIGMLSHDGGEFTMPVMLNPSVAMRDPVFYRWHKLIDDLLYRHQALLTPNHPVEGEFPLLWAGVSVDSISVHSENQSPNSLRTYFATLNVSMPLQEDIFRSEEVTDYCLKRLNYDAFSYNITINKQSYVRSNRATVRIFMAPRFNESGHQFTLDDQTRQFFAMDAFTVHLDVGQTTFTRNASFSSLNLNWKLETWMESPPSGEDPECGCGWPQHLFIPKGTQEGMAFDFFVMVTDAEIDDPSSSLPTLGVTSSKQEPICKMSMIICGIQSEKYPDTRPMGYPFNTRPFSIETQEDGSRMVSDLEEYVTLLPNTKAIQVIIKHDGELLNYN